MRRIKTGVIGCGMISEVYLRNMTTVFSDILDVTSCSDLNMKAAEKRAEQFNIRAVEMDQIFQDPEVELIVNLTIPSAHYEIAKRTLESGKHAYSEKPLALTLEEGRELIDLAGKKGLFIGAAPDTFLGGGLQTCREIIDKGMIGQPVFAQGYMLARGPESFHPNPEFFYKEGAGPLLDMGPYYFTALTALFGPAVRVAGMSKKTFDYRKVQAKSSPKCGEDFPVEVDTFISGNIEFQNGVNANVTTSWDMNNPYWKAGVPLLQVFGTEATLILPDPNTFGGINDGPNEKPGKYVIIRKGSGDTEEIEVKQQYIENSRGLGAADLAWHIIHGGEPRASGGNALHVLEIMLGILKSGKDGVYYRMTTPYERPELLGENHFNE